MHSFLRSHTNPFVCFTRTPALSSADYFSSIFEPIYNSSENKPSLKSIHPPKLAVFFATLALSGMNDVEEPDIIELARSYTPVAQAALSFLPLTIQTNLCCATLQGLF